MGGMPLPKIPGPPAAPTKDSAAQTVNNQGNKPKKMGYGSTVLTGAGATQNPERKTLLGE